MVREFTVPSFSFLFFGIGCGPDVPTVNFDSYLVINLFFRLLVANRFRHASVQIGDKAFYTLKARDLRLAASGGNFSSKQESFDDENTEGLEVLRERAPTNPVSDSQIDGCSVHKQETSNSGKVELGDSQESTTTGASASLSSGGSSGSFYSAESESKNSSSSTSVTSLCDSNLPAPTETSSITKDPSACQASETGLAQSGANQVDTHDEQPHTTGSDSAEADADADEDSDGLEVVIPKVKGANIAGALKHDSGLSHGVRYPTKRRKKRLRRKRKVAPPLQVKVGDKVCVEVSNTCTTVDVIWQDGSKQEKVLSTDLIPVFHLDELEFFPGDYVSDKRGQLRIKSNTCLFLKEFEDSVRNYLNPFNYMYFRLVYSCTFDTQSKTALM